MTDKAITAPANMTPELEIFKDLIKDYMKRIIVGEDTDVYIDEVRWIVFLVNDKLRKSFDDRARKTGNATIRSFKEVSESRDLTEEEAEALADKLIG